MRCPWAWPYRPPVYYLTFGYKNANLISKVPILKSKICFRRMKIPRSKKWVFWEKRLYIFYHFCILLFPDLLLSSHLLRLCLMLPNRGREGEREAPPGTRRKLEPDTIVSVRSQQISISQSNHRARVSLNWIVCKIIYLQYLPLCGWRGKDTRLGNFHGWYNLMFSWL